MQGTNHSGLQCVQHPCQQITNFCLHFDCLRPLCPDCVQIHTKQHQQQEIQSWKHCINKSAMNLKKTLDILRKTYDQQNKYRSYKSIDTVEAQNIKKLYQIKTKIQQMMDDIFNSYEKQLRNLIRSQYHLELPDTIKLRMAIEEIQKIMMKLGHNGTVVSALKKSLILDYEELLKYFENTKNQSQKNNINDVFIQENIPSYQCLKQAINQTVLIKKNNNHNNNRNNNNSTMNHNLSENNQNYNKYQSPINNHNFNSSSRPSNLINPDFTNKPTNDMINITKLDYFEKDCSYKYLHFFIPNSNELKICNIEGNSWRSIKFQSKQDIPCYFKSIATPKGEIYLTGGIAKNNNRINDIFQYNFQENKLNFITRMKYSRSSHSICYLNQSIYLIGGFSISQGQPIQHCQIYDIKQKKCKSITSMNVPTANSSITTFNNEIIFKIGGFISNSQQNNIIQMYEIYSNKWTIVQIRKNQNMPQLKLLSFSASLQINQNDILVFGGYENSEIEKPVKLCYTLSINILQICAYVTNYNTYPLPYAQGFWNSHPILHQKKVYALQNITDNDEQLSALADQRRILVFNGQNWL